MDCTEIFGHLKTSLPSTQLHLKKKYILLIRSVKWIVVMIHCQPSANPHIEAAEVLFHFAFSLSIRVQISKVLPYSDMVSSVLS